MANILAISGLAGAGKNTVADFIKEKYPEKTIEIVSFASKLKDIVSVMFEDKCHNIYQTLESEKYLNEVFKTIEEYKKGNSDTSRLEEELAVLNEFVPAGLTEEQIEEAETPVEEIEEAKRKKNQRRAKLIQTLKINEIKHFFATLFAPITRTLAAIKAKKEEEGE